MKPKRKCEQAECNLENALERMRRASHKNEKAVALHLRRHEQPQLEEQPPELEPLGLEDSGLHAL